MPDARALTQTGAAPRRARPTRRAVVAAGGGGALSLALAACGAGSSGAEQEGAGAPAASQPVSLDLWHSYGTTQGGGLAMLDQLEEYRRRRPHVTVVNTADASREKFIAALAADTVPDLYKLSASEVIEFGEQNVLLPLDAMIKRDRWDLRHYFDFVVQHTSYKGQVLSITHHPDIRLM
ncbi:MAG: hypothetical protein M3442_02990, partial [Chloroflexota bacterium]|nr:hypothetical protein [Chloroflexota bacterium]